MALSSPHPEQRPILPRPGDSAEMATSTSTSTATATATDTDIRTTMSNSSSAPTAVCSNSITATGDSPSTEEGGVIVPINSSTVERIVAGQAITDLASCVKELVDNAIDAGSRSINIRLFNQGLDIVEVSDDGCGVPKSSRPLMAAKHATSKIRSFDDIYAANSNSIGSSSFSSQLGFRGEALFCLANISQKLVIATRTSSDHMGQKFEFRHDGTVNESSVVDVPRKIGTTVAVVKLFDALPVRRADLMKRIKNQRAKMFKMMQGYAILCLGMRLSVFDITGTAGKTSYKSEVKLSTSDKSTSYEETVSSVLGTKFLSGLTRISVDLTTILMKTTGEKDKKAGEGGQVDVRQIGNGVGDGSDSPSPTWKIEGLVSNSPRLGGSAGTAARDLQFFSINGRPVDLPKISRVLGDAWKTFDAAAGGGSGGGGRGSTNKRPACVLAFTLPGRSYDVNLSPDKREVILTEEGDISDLLRDELIKVWSSQSEGTFAANEVESLSNRKGKSNVGQKKDDTALFTSIRTFPVASPSAADITSSYGTPRTCGAKMKRRNAFVHDFKNIRPTEERYFNSPRVGWRSNETTTTPTATTDNELLQDDRIEGFAKRTDEVSKQFDKDPLLDTNSSPPTVSPRKRDYESIDTSKKVTPESADADQATATISSVDNLHFLRSSLGGGGSKAAVIETSDRERQQWTQTRERFNRSHYDDQEEEIRSLDPMEELKPAGVGINDVGVKMKDLELMESSRIQRGSQSIDKDSNRTEAGQGAADSSSFSTFSRKRLKRSVESRLITLDDFAYGSKGDAGDQKRVSNLESSRPKISESRDIEFTTEADGSMNRGKIDSGYVPDEGNTRGVTRRMNAVYSPQEEGTRMKSSSGPSSSPLPGENRACSEPLRDTSTSSSAVSCSTVVSSGSPDLYSSTPVVSKAQANDTKKKQVTADSTRNSESAVWHTFRGTKDVIRVSRAARLHMNVARKGLKWKKLGKYRCRSHSLSNSDATNGGADEIVEIPDVKDEDTTLGSKQRKGTVSLSKEDFLHMTVIGQFNLGFILARCRSQHLWILDQHACDEKYNFERLCAATVIHEQKLIAPLPLELSPSEENCIVENMVVFEKNGFRFSYDPQKPPRHRLALTALPHSGARDGCKAVQFGKDDVSALCAMLGADGASSSTSYGAGYGTGADGRGLNGNNAVRRYAGTAGVSFNEYSRKKGIMGSNIVRLPKAVAMFASRACRGSIMIGKALSQKEMESVVRKLHNVEQPWDCPHGRPTMRHVRDLADCLRDDEYTAAINITEPSLIVLSQPDDEQDEVQIANV